MGKTKTRSAVANYRKMRTMTQRQLAVIVGISRANLSKIELGQAMPPFHVKLRLSAVLGCTPSDLFPEPEIPRPTIEELVTTGDLIRET